MIARRPIRFLVAVTGGWVGMRAALLWPTPEILPAMVDTIAPAARAEIRPIRSALLRTRVKTSEVVPASAAMVGHAEPGRRDLLGSPASSHVRHVPTASQAATPASPAGRSFELSQAPPAGTQPQPAFDTGRFSGSAWAIVRPDGRSQPFASQLGGGQAGVRLAYAVDPARRLALVARLSTALDSRQTEAGVGIDWRPTSLPVHLVAERRIGIEGSAGGYAIGAIGGLGPQRVLAFAHLEAYGQGGVIVRDRRASGFADGQVRVTRPIAEVGRTGLAAGIGAWGAVQEGAARLDVGPSIDARLPVGGRFMRLSLDWRQRIAGQASPASGPALSLGADF